MFFSFGPPRNKTNTCQLQTCLQLGIPHTSHCYDILPWLRDNAVRVAGGDASTVHIPCDFTKEGRGSSTGYI